MNAMKRKNAKKRNTNPTIFQVLSSLASSFRLIFSSFSGFSFSDLVFPVLPTGFLVELPFNLLAIWNKDNNKPPTMDSSCFQHLHNFIVKSPSLKAQTDMKKTSIGNRH